MKRLKYKKIPFCSVAASEKNQLKPLQEIQKSTAESQSLKPATLLFPLLFF